MASTGFRGTAIGVSTLGALLIAALIVFADSPQPPPRLPASGRAATGIPRGSEDKARIYYADLARVLRYKTPTTILDSTLIRASKVLDGLKLGGDEQIGVAIVRRAIEEPMRWIATNAGHEGSIVVARVRGMHGDEGFKALTERYENLVDAGVIDPTKVVRTALEKSSSIASLLLTTEACVSEYTSESDASTAALGTVGAWRSTAAGAAPKTSPSARSARKLLDL